MLAAETGTSARLVPCLTDDAECTAGSRFTACGLPRFRHGVYSKSLMARIVGRIEDPEAWRSVDERRASREARAMRAAAWRLAARYRAAGDDVGGLARETCRTWAGRVTAFFIALNDDVRLVQCAICRRSYRPSAGPEVFAIADDRADPIHLDCAIRAQPDLAALVARLGMREGWVPRSSNGGPRRFGRRCQKGPGFQMISINRTAEGGPRDY